jgi:hypothetical protein
MLGSLAGRESTSKSNDHRWPLGTPGGDFVQPDEGGVFHSKSAVPETYDAVQIILDLGFVRIGN